jgi:hypothetical protein
VNTTTELIGLMAAIIYAGGDLDNPDRHEAAVENAVRLFSLTAPLLKKVEQEDVSSKF